MKSDRVAICRLRGCHTPSSPFSGSVCVVCGQKLSLKDLGYAIIRRSRSQKS